MKKKCIREAMIFLRKFRLFLVRTKLLSLSSVASFFVVQRKVDKSFFQRMSYGGPFKTFMNETPQR